MSALHSSEAVSPWTLIGTFVVLASVYTLYNVFYILFLGPYAKIPGPWMNKLSRIPFILHLRSGTTVENTVKLHAKYGPVVQLSPGDISFTSIESAWPQIYGFRTGELKGHKNHPKDQAWLGPKPWGVENVLRSHAENHGRQRKLLSHAFSEKALNAQEDILQEYVDKFIDAMRSQSATKSAYIDMVEYYNWCTFDVIGDLLFGESFGNLDTLRTHDHIQRIFKSLANFSSGYMRKYIPFAEYFGHFFISAEAMAQQRKGWDFIAQQVEKRKARDTDRQDFMQLILAHNGDKGQTLSNHEIYANAVLIVAAGSETTATLLSGLTWLLLKNPDVLAKLNKEVREHFTSYEDITLHEVAKVPYLLAVLNEGLRYFPPVPTGFNRVIAEGGEMVSGYMIPQDTSVCVSSFAAHHDPRNFTDPEQFVPERWLGKDERYANDKLNDIQPFSFGPHACLGKNLAYGEMRLILAKIIWSFDLELDPAAANWLDECKVFALWRKPELPVLVKEVQR